MSAALLRITRSESRGRRANGEVGLCLSWKAAHKPVLKHHLTQPTLPIASTLSSRQGAQRDGPCSESLVPLVPVFQHAQKNKVERKGWHMDLFKRKEKSKEMTLATGQHNFTSML